MNLCEISANTRSEQLIKQYELLRIIQEQGLSVKPIMNKLTGKFDTNLIDINENLCYILPLDNSPLMVSEVVLKNADVIIACYKRFGWTDYYIIPTDIVEENKLSYSFVFEHFKDAWEFLKI